MNSEQRNANKKGFVPDQSSEAFAVTPINKGNVTMSSVVKFDNKVQSITSLEISELVEKRHDNVKRAIESLVNQEIIARPQIEVVQNTVNNRAYSTDVFVFVGERGKRDSIVVVAQLCPEFTARLVDRWQELETQVQQPTLALPNFTDPAEAAIAWAAEFKAKQLAQVQVMQLETKLTEIQPDIDALARIAKADGSLCMRDAANNLQVRQNELKRFLIANAWIYKRNGNDAWHGYSDKLQAGYLEHKSTTVKASDGITDKIVEQVRITPKGLAKLAKIFAKGEAA